MEETDQFHLTIYAAGPVEALAETLAGILDATSIVMVTGFWDTGIGIQSQEGAKIEGIADSFRIMIAIAAAQEWLDGSGQPALTVEIHPTFARSLNPDN